MSSSTTVMSPGGEGESRAVAGIETDTLGGVKSTGTVAAWLFAFFGTATCGRGSSGGIRVSSRSATVAERLREGGQQ